mmetsp:Transcript_2039/g.4762  ORF Transcript_2039/g.4762 Transcript_2039/m.4762 type:complete len:200 (+) Transcript_2039:454-1053(+)
MGRPLSPPAGRLSPRRPPCTLPWRIPASPSRWRVPRPRSARATTRRTGTTSTGRLCVPTSGTCVASVASRSRGWVNPSPSGAGAGSPPATTRSVFRVTQTRAARRGAPHTKGTSWARSTRPRQIRCSTKCGRGATSRAGRPEKAWGRKWQWADWGLRGRVGAKGCTGWLGVGVARVRRAVPGLLAEARRPRIRTRIRRP